MEQLDEFAFARTRPGTIGGRYLRRFWQPVCRARDLELGRAVTVRIMSESFTLYRGESGAPHVVASACPHRGTRLSAGWVEGEHIRCFYHGWTYDSAGQCVEQPGEDEGFAAKVRIASYPAQEYLGLIFAYFGEGQPPELPRYAEFDAPGVIDAYPPEYWPCNFFNRIDNAPDAAHLTFAHRESRDAVNSARSLPQVSAQETEYGVVTYMAAPGKPLRSVHFHMPNINMFLAEASLRDPRGVLGNGYVGRLLYRVPVDDESCVSFPLDHVPLTGEAGQAYLERRHAVEDEQLTPERDPVNIAEAVLANKSTTADVRRGTLANLKTLTSVEDYVAQVAQGSPFGRQERLGRMDAGIILIRRLWMREMQALVEGKPLTNWMRATRLDATPS